MHRNANLDLLRAIAISLVVVYHVVQMWPASLQVLRQYTALGAYGVDLFFVLSGWLIGGLYWREHAVSGKVAAGRFILRRLLRTVPCYLVALLCSWLAVRMAEPQRASFDPRYLLFLQNYEETMPYFLVSWSLCIEEHFYLLLPLTLLVIIRRKPAWLDRIWWACLLPPIFRAWECRHDIGAFGFAWTATHFRFEGLLAGVAAARCHQMSGARWGTFTSRARLLWLPLLAAAVTLFFVSKSGFYVIGLSLFAAGFLCLLVQWVTGPEARIASHGWVKAVALASYSTYLTHALAIHLSRQTISRLGIASPLLQCLVFATVIVFFGWAFFVLVEKPSLRLRDRLVPSPLQRIP